MSQHPCELTIEDLQTIDFDLVDLDNAVSAEIIGGTATLSRAAEQGGGEDPVPSLSTNIVIEAGGSPQPPMNTGIVIESGGFPYYTGLPFEIGGGFPSFPRHRRRVHR